MGQRGWRSFAGQSPWYKAIQPIASSLNCTSQSLRPLCQQGTALGEAIHGLLRTSPTFLTGWGTEKASYACAKNSCASPSQGAALSYRAMAAHLVSGLPLWAWSPGTHGRRAVSAPCHLVTGTGFCRVSQLGLGPSVTAGGCFKRETVSVQLRPH